ncbi:MAG: hypothetical protein PHE84_01800 [bacterium]|nr:hypothetical protein [bacterium]
MKQLSVVFLVLSLVLTTCKGGGRVAPTGSSEHQNEPEDAGPQCAKIVLSESAVQGVIAKVSGPKFDGVRNGFLDVMRLYHKAIATSSLGALTIGKGGYFTVQGLQVEDSMDLTRKRLSYTIDEFDAYGKPIDSGTYSMEIKKDGNEWSVRFGPAMNNLFTEKMHLGVWLNDLDKVFKRLWTSEGLAAKYAGCSGSAGVN